MANEPGEWMYSQPTWVLTHRPQIIDPTHPVTAFSGGRGTFIRTSSRRPATGDVWVVGGGQVAAHFVTAGLVDEMIISYAPCSWARAPRSLPVRSEWTLIESRVNGDFCMARWAFTR